MSRIYNVEILTRGREYIFKSCKSNSEVAVALEELKEQLATQTFVDCTTIDGWWYVRPMTVESIGIVPVAPEKIRGGQS